MPNNSIYNTKNDKVTNLLDKEFTNIHKVLCNDIKNKNPLLDMKIGNKNIRLVNLFTNYDYSSRYDLDLNSHVISAVMNSTVKYLANQELNKEENKNKHKEPNSAKVLSKVTENIVNISNITDNKIRRPSDSYMVTWLTQPSYMVRGFLLDDNTLDVKDTTNFLFASTATAHILSFIFALNNDFRLKDSKDFGCITVTLVDNMFKYVSWFLNNFKIDKTIEDYEKEPSIYKKSLLGAYVIYYLLQNHSKLIEETLKKYAMFNSITLETLNAWFEIVLNSSRKESNVVFSKSIEVNKENLKTYIKDEGNKGNTWLEEIQYNFFNTLNVHMFKNHESIIDCIKNYSHYFKSNITLFTAFTVYETEDIRNLILMDIWSQSNGFTLWSTNIFRLLAHKNVMEICAFRIAEDTKKAIDTFIVNEKDYAKSNRKNTKELLAVQKECEEIKKQYEALKNINNANDLALGLKELEKTNELLCCELDIAQKDFKSKDDKLEGYKNRIMSLESKEITAYFDKERVRTLEKENLVLKQELEEVKAKLSCVCSTEDYDTNNVDAVNKCREDMLLKLKDLCIVTVGGKVNADKFESYLPNYQNIDTTANPRTIDIPQNVDYLLINTNSIKHKYTNLAKNYVAKNPNCNLLLLSAINVDKVIDMLYKKECEKITSTNTMTLSC